MNLLLFRKITIVSSLTETELVSRLSEIVDLKKSSRFSFNYEDPTKLYVGQIESSRFKIYRIVKGTNSFRPIIQGNIIDNLSTRVIELKMRLHFIVVLFLLWLSGFIIYCIIKNSDSDYSELIFIGLVLGMTIFFFNQECNKSTKDLEDIFID